MINRSKEWIENTRVKKAKKEILEHKKSINIKQIESTQNMQTDRLDITADITTTDLHIEIIVEWTDKEVTDMGKKVGDWLIVMTELLFMIVKVFIMDISTVTDIFLKVYSTDMTDTIRIKTE